MTTQDAGPAPKFDWTKEEEQLLTRVLHVNLISQDRLEVGATAPTTRVPELVGWLVASAAGALFGQYQMYLSQEHGIAATAVAWLLICLGVTIGRVPIYHPLPTVAVSLFPGTLWWIRHRGAHGSLEQLVSYSPLEGRTLAFETDVQGVTLTTRHGLPQDDYQRCYQLLTERCCHNLNPTADVPGRVSALAESGALALPRRMYVLLLQDLSPDFVGSDKLVLRTRFRALRCFLLVAGLDTLVGLSVAAFSLMGTLPASLGDAPGNWALILNLVLFGAPVALGLVQGGIVRRFLYPGRLVILEKAAPTISVRDRTKEMRLDCSDCSVWLHSGNEGNGSTVVSHKHKKIATWTLSSCVKWDEERLLTDTVASYLTKGGRDGF